MINFTRLSAFLSIFRSHAGRAWEQGKCVCMCICWQGVVCWLQRKDVVWGIFNTRRHKFQLRTSKMSGGCYEYSNCTSICLNCQTQMEWKQNNLLFLLLLCKYIHQGLSPISIHYTGCWQWPGFYLSLSDTKVDHIPPEMPSVPAHLWLPSSRHQHGLSAGEIATKFNFQSLIFQHLRFKVFTVYVAPSLVPRLSPNAYCKRQKAG